MAWDSKVVWSEGLLIQPHHFQQADRYHEALVSGLTRRVAPYAWGVSQLDIDTDMLKLGKFAIRSASGLTPDGAVFRVPEVEAHPPAIDVPETIKDCVVYLTIPSRRQGAEEVDLTTRNLPTTRYLPEEMEITDTMGKTRRPVTMATARLRLGFAFAVDDLSDLLLIPIARIIEVRADKEVILDTGFIASCLDVRAAPPLQGFLREIEGMLGHRMAALSGRFAEVGPAKAVADITDFLLLITVNRWLPVMRHMLSVENVHPIQAFERTAALAGELAAFMAADRAAPELPPYQHDNLTVVFQAVMRVLRQYLSAVLETAAVSIALEERNYGVRVGIIADRKLLGTSQFVLAVQADIPAETVRRHFPAQAKVGPVEEIRKLVNSALPGIGVTGLPVAPRQIPYHAGMVYFELDASSAYWSKITTSGGLAFFVAGEFPGLQMELWAIRQG
ncbi:MAG: type VI secretion system baseplate subunit TssK [Pseudomonadota bacterium]